MNDNLSLIAAAAGGFLLSVAVTGIIQGAPVTSLQARNSFNASPVANVSFVATQDSKVNFKQRHHS